MFAAIREKLVGAWVKLRQGSLAKLFVFEFVVVLLGVLAAQWVAELADDRKSIDRMEAARERLRADLGDTLWLAQMYEVTAPCVDERMAQIMRVAGTGDSPAPGLLNRPFLPLLQIAPLAEEDVILFRERFGTEEYDAVDSMRTLSQSMDEEMAKISTLWRALLVIDPENGPVSDLDRANARHDAALLRASMRRIEANSEVIRRRAETAKIEVSQYSDIRMPADCDDLWSNNSFTIGAGQN